MKMFKKSKNWRFSKGVKPWFWSKNGQFSNYYFLGNIGQEKVFDYIIEPKNALLGYQNKTFFEKGLTHGFRPKMAILQTFFFKAI